MRMETTDEQLASAAALGDTAAFAALLPRVYDRLFALCFRLTANRAEAEDLTQDICAALPAKIRSFRNDARFTTWLYRVAVNAAHDRRRRHAARTRAADGWGDWETARQDAMTEDRARTDWLIHAIGRLPDDLRDTLALILDDITQAEAARILDISEGTVAWRVSEAKKRLRAMKEETA